MAFSSHDHPAADISAPAAHGWRVALASAYCLVFGPSAILVTGFGAFARPLAHEFGWSPAAIVSAVIILALVIMVVSMVQGALIDRFGARRLILWSIPAFVFGLVAMARLPSDIRLFYAAFVIVPFLAIGIWPVSYMKLTGSWFSRHLGLALGTANAGIGLGAMVVTPVAAWVIAHHGWRAAYLALALLALTTLPVAWAVVRGSPSAAGGAPRATPQPMPWRDRELVTIVFGYLLIGITGTGLLTNLLPMMVATGFSATTAVLGMTLFGVTSLLGRFVSGFLLDHYPARRVILLFTAVSAVGLIAFTIGLTGWPIFAAVIAFGLLSGGEFDVLAYCVRRYFGMAVFGRAYGLAFSAFQLGAAIGAGGLAWSLGATGSYRAGLCGMALSQLLALAMFSRLGPYRHD